MTFEEYQKEQRQNYAGLAKTVRNLIEMTVDSAVKAKADLGQPQAYHARAKDIASLRRRLVEIGIKEKKDVLNSSNIEDYKKDLAGVRVIFYSNDDVSRFINSRIVHNLFDCEDEKIHTPTKENGYNEYRAHHFIIKLKSDRASLIEYADLSGKRCEIQVHTILNHAWSETTHDVLYKQEDWSAYGSRVLEKIRDQMQLLMKNHLVPAGYDLDRALRDYQTLKNGKALFDQGPIEALGKAASNAERVQLLSDIRDKVIPMLEKLDEQHPLLIQFVAEAMRAARNGN